MHQQQQPPYSETYTDSARAPSALAPAPAPRSATPMDTVLTRKWTAAVIAHGYTAVPDLLLSHMSQLGLTPTELVLLLQLLRYWWTAEHLPFPSKRKLAQAMGCSEKNVQKVMKGLEARGFVVRVQRRRAADRSDSNIYCLDPLVGKLRAVVASCQRSQNQIEPDPVNLVATEEEEAPMPTHDERQQTDGPLTRNARFEAKVAQVRARLGVR